MTRLLPYFLITALLMISGCGKTATNRVAVTLPAISSIVNDLTAGTSITVVDFIPQSISIAELDQFLDEHPTLLDSVAACDAIFDLRSVIPEDIAYLQLRNRNIRIVESDCAVPLDPTITPIPLISAAEGAPHYVWLSISNAMKMAEIAAKDLSKLYPHESSTISKNLADFKQRYFALKIATESAFSEIPLFEAATIGTDFDYLLKDVNLFVTDRYPADETTWPDSLAQSLLTKATAGAIHTIVHRWNPTGALGEALDSAHVKTAVLVVGDPALHAFDKGLYGLIESNCAALRSTLSN